MVAKAAAYRHMKAGWHTNIENNQHQRKLSWRKAAAICNNGAESLARHLAA
jgi:hypothetical protein